jgi:hypothetical protein
MLPNVMGQKLRIDAQSRAPEQELFRARRALEHLRDLRANGQWRRYYREETFTGVLRQAEQDVDHWMQVCSQRAHAKRNRYSF